MLTETFYYSNNYSDIEKKHIKKVVVYLDTGFLIRALNFAEKEFCTPCHELLDMLNAMNTKIRCFQHTLDELHGIFTAATGQLQQYGRLHPRKPGDLFDIINRKSFSSSDCLILMESLEDKLNKLNIYVERKPKIIKAYSIDENALSNELEAALENQNQKARENDIDSLQAIFQIREGQRKYYLENCKAIFITTNSALARASTHYFNREYGNSNAPICMFDLVFTSLIWMKFMKKMPNLPKDRLAANCYSALMPTDKQWLEYVKEVEKLKEKGSINEETITIS